MANTENPKVEFTRKGLVPAKLVSMYVPSTGGADEEYYNSTLTTFLLNPSSWTESKSANWVKHNIPGNSDPHQQWTSSGARTITFEALVTNDKADGTVVKDVKQLYTTTSVIKRLGTIAAQAFNISGVNLNSIGQINQGSGLNLDINYKLNYYRSLCYPSVTSDSNRVDKAPKLVKLVVGSTFGKRAQTARFVVDKVDITITKQYPDLTPIEARVTFTLTEFVGTILCAETNIATDS